jgi:hypothetical protein
MMVGGWPAAAATRAVRGAAALRRMTLGIAVLVIAQMSIGMIVNLYLTVPVHHPGAQPANYFTGSLRSIAWAIGHGGPALAIHAALGLVERQATFAVLRTARSLVSSAWWLRQAM